MELCKKIKSLFVREEQSAGLDKIKIKKQIDLASKFLNDMVLELPREALLNMYKTLYIMELIFNMVVQWIILDEIKLNEYILTTKGKQICNFLHTMTNSPEFNSSEFRLFINNKIADLFLQLSQINNENSLKDNKDNINK